ncbi:MAG: hypothetical protein HY885_18265 [Deltaproteobacteria bacterium]|nr:hypothetical protein [Deltaproteobacteria bacterium]
MTTDTCCQNIERELSCWKGRLDEVAHKFDAVPSIDKYKLTPHIEGIHILLTELDDRINTLRKECPSN